MSDALIEGIRPASAHGATGPGAMLRAVRLQRGLHIGALAAAMKVPQAKLEALEADRFADLPDATFVRALALSVSRTLKTDPAPILALLPGAPHIHLERVDGGLNMPFRERPGHIAPVEWAAGNWPLIGIVAALLLAAAGMAWAPHDWLRALPSFRPTPAPPVDAAATVPAPDRQSAPVALSASALAGTRVESVSAAAAQPTSAVPGETASSSVAGVGAPNPQAIVRIRAIEDTWIQATDAGDKIVLSRLLSAGEVVGLEGAAALKIRVGNAKGTELMHRGQVLDLKPSTRDNVATVDLR
jgi:cytoskeleton protein RodZ